MYRSVPLYSDSYYPQGYDHALHSSYHPHYQNRYPYLQQQRAAEERALAQAQAEELAAKRAKRAQWLPDEVYDDNYYSDEEDLHSQLGPRERAYVEAKQRQALLEAERDRERIRKEQGQQRKWEEDLERRRMEDDEGGRRRFNEEKERRKRIQTEHELKRRQQHQGRSRSPSRAGSRTPFNEQGRSSPKQAIPIRSRPPSLTRPDAPSSSTQPQTQQPPTYTPEHVEAARTIQKHYRIHRSLLTIHSLDKEFKKLKKEFNPPSSIVFQDPKGGLSDVVVAPAIPFGELDDDHRTGAGVGDEGGVDSRVIDRAADNVAVISGDGSNNKGQENGTAHMSMDVNSEPDSMNICNDPKCSESEQKDSIVIPPARLAYTAQNYNLNAYIDLLDKLLVKLDGVESFGDRKVRERRRWLVKKVEGELARVERFWRESWARHVLRQNGS